MTVSYKILYKIIYQVPVKYKLNMKLLLAIHALCINGSSTQLK